MACIPPTLEGWVYIVPTHGPLDGPLTHGLNILQQIPQGFFSYMSVEFENEAK